MEDIVVLGFFALIGVIILRFIFSLGSRPEVPPSPYTYMPPLPYQGYYVPVKIKRRKVVIVPESALKKRKRRRRI